MQQCFEEYFRVLKPGRWMTVVFHNSWNAVWNAIQEAMQAAGSWWRMYARWTRSKAPTAR